MATDIRQLLPTNVRAALLAGSAPSSINPYVTASALSSFGFVPYTGATANVDLGAFSLTSPAIYGSSLASGTLTLASTSNATKGKILFGTSAYDEVNNRLGIGTTSPAFDFDLIKSVPASYVGANVQNTSATGYSFIEVLGNNNTTYASLNVFNTAGGVGTFYDNNTAGVATNSPTLSFLTNESATGGWVLTAGGYGTGSEKARFTINATSFTQAAATSGTITPFRFTSPANTNQTATTNIPNFKVTGSNKQWATGTVANQYWNYLTSNTAAFVGASTMTNSYGLFVEAATAGTNATITNNYAAGFGGSIDIVTGNINLLNTTSSTTGVITKAGVRFIHDFAASGTTGQNTWIGVGAGNFTLTGSSAGTAGGFNVAVGYGAAAATTTGNFNTIMGHNAGNGITTGGFNVAIGRLAGSAIGAGGSNIYIGEQAGGSNAGSNNTMIGHRAGIGGTAFSSVVAIGYVAGQNNTASNVVFIGTSTGSANTSGTGNTAVGHSALQVNQTGLNNTALGFNALLNVLNVNHNTAVGYLAGSGLTTGSENTILGALSMQSGSATATSNVAIGYNTLRFGTGNNNICVGNNAGSNNSMTGTSNLFVGVSSGVANTSGSSNVFLGTSAGNANTTGGSSVAIGSSTMIAHNGATGQNVVIGSIAGNNITSGYNMTIVGYGSGAGITTGNQNTILGANVTGLAAALVNNIILAQGDGAIRYRYNPMAGSGGLFQFTPASTTGQTASTEIPVLKVNASTTTIAQGALTTQRFTYLPSQTLAFAAASTATNVFGLFVEAATAGTNATITNNYALGLGGNILINTGAGAGRIRSSEYSSNLGALYFNQTSPDGSNYSISGIDNANTLINGKTTVNIRINGSDAFNVTSTVITYKDGINLAFNTTTGSKIMTSNLQKGAFWGATPIVQPTTAVAAATLVSNAGTALTSTDTFDGYTLQQAVKALRDTGLLA